jgi:iron complex outermembrane receptor protein
LNYDDHTWFGGALLRAAAEQNHYSAGQGNIAGQDIGRSGGFATVSLHAGYRPTKQTVVTAGVDNLFDKNYAEFISRSGSNGMGSPITGFVQTTRVNEPGRTIWLKGTINF